MGFVTSLTESIAHARAMGAGRSSSAERPDEVKTGVDEASVTVAAASKLVDHVHELSHADNAVAKARKVASGVSSAAKASKLSARKEEVVEATAARKAGSEATKAVSRARTAVLEKAELRLPLSKLVESLNGKDENVALRYKRVLEAVGCYALLTYPKVDLTNDLSGYRAVYVGKAICVGEDIAEAISRNGSPDVYADVKYNQNVWVCVFPCMERDLDQRYRALVNVLGAKESYNADAE